MRSELYLEKIKDILNLDQFEKQTVSRKNAKDLCLKEEKRINIELSNLLEDGKISQFLYKEMKSTGGQLPRLYGLAKVHKTNVPIRPVLSMPSSPYYRIAGKVTKWLSVIPQSKINCSSKKTVDQLKSVHLDDSEVMISFDVSSLYTNASVEEAI